MKPAAFDYHSPHTPAEAVDLAARLGDEGKFIAGGQSLMPLLALRLAAFGHLVDLRCLTELQGIHAHDVSMVIDRQGVAVRAGTHCAQPLLKRFGVTSTCRASFGMYNTRAEVDALVEALEKARKFFG